MKTGPRLIVHAPFVEPDGQNQLRVMSCLIVTQESLALNEDHGITRRLGNVSLDNPGRGCFTQPKVAVLGYLGKATMIPINLNEVATTAR